MAGRRRGLSMTVSSPGGDMRPWYCCKIFNEHRLCDVLLKSGRTSPLPVTLAGPGNPVTVLVQRVMVIVGLSSLPAQTAPCSNCNELKPKSQIQRGDESGADSSRESEGGCWASSSVRTRVRTGANVGNLLIVSSNRVFTGAAFSGISSKTHSRSLTGGMSTRVSALSMSGRTIKSAEGLSFIAG